MSLLNLLQPNSYDLYCNKIVEKVGSPSEMFSAYLPTLQILSQVSNTKINCTGTLISNPNYNSSTSTYTVPHNGVYLVNASLGVDFSVHIADKNLRLNFSLVSNGSNIIRSSIYNSSPPIDTENHVNLQIVELSNFTAGQQLTIQLDTPVLEAGGSWTSSNYPFANTGDTYWSIIEQ